jgi:hypothetical protein
MTRRSESWIRRNWAALAAAGYFVAFLLGGIRWLRFHNEDRAIDAVFSLFFAIASTFGHRASRSEQEYREAMRRMQSEHPLETSPK